MSLFLLIMFRIICVHGYRRFGAGDSVLGEILSLNSLSVYMSKIVGVDLIISGKKSSYVPLVYQVANH